MTSFDERERAFENRFAHDQELKFKAVSRRNRMVGMWAAELMGRSGGDAEAYATEIVRADIDTPGHEDVFRRLKDDLDAAGAGITEEQLRTKMSEFLLQAADEVASS